jgi:hypothetical protein
MGASHRVTPAAMRWSTCVCSIAAQLLESARRWLVSQYLSESIRRLMTATASLIKAGLIFHALFVLSVSFLGAISDASCPSRRRLRRMRKKSRLFSLAPPHGPHTTCCPIITLALFRLTTASARRNPRESQSPALACGCRAADASTGLNRPHGDPQWHPSSCSKRLRQVGPVATCATPDLLLQHLDETLATYV